jgi:hypothetical protein
MITAIKPEANVDFFQRVGDIATLHCQPRKRQ